MTAEELKQALQALGWKQSELARRVDVGDSTVSHWTTGETPVPGPVAAYLGMAQEIDRLHRQYVRPIKPARATAEEEAPAPADTGSEGRAGRRVRELGAAADLFVGARPDKTAPEA
jgi:transcriptional regulator with XRE-family HTH domain